MHLSLVPPCRAQPAALRSPLRTCTLQEATEYPQAVSQLGVGVMTLIFTAEMLAQLGGPCGDGPALLAVLAVLVPLSWVRKARLPAGRPPPHGV